jgi:hypothetical protein
VERALVTADDCGTPAKPGRSGVAT